MTPRSMILIVAALLIAAGTAFFVRSWLSAERAQVTAAVPAPAPAPTKPVLVAKANLPAGTFIRKEHLRWQAWPDDALNANYKIQGQHELGDVTGAVVRRGIVAGQPVTEAQIARPGDRGFLAAVLKPGMRAIAISVNNVTGVAGLVFPGDRVDVVLTHSLSKDENSDGRAIRASETILENVRILAIGQNLNDQAEKPMAGNTATIELTPKQVEFMTVAAELGRLSLSLRSLANSGERTEDAVLAATEIADGSAEDDAVVDINAIAEPERGRTHTLDGEVSRLLGRGGGGQKQNNSHSVKVYYGTTSTEVRTQGLSNAVGQQTRSTAAGADAVATAAGTQAD